MGRKRTGQISEIAPGKFRIKIQRGTSINRKSFNETFEGTREDAEIFLQKCLAKILEFERTPERAKTVSIIINDYLTRRAKRNISEKTYVGYENILRRYITPNIGEKLISEVRASDVRKFYDDLGNGEYTLCYLDKGEPKLKKGTTRLSSSVIHKVHTLLKPAFSFALEMEWLNANPMQAVAAPKRKQESNWLVPTPAEMETIFQNCRSTEERAMWETAYFTGTRPEEYIALRWSDIDFNTGLLKVERVSVEMPGGKKNWLYKKPKTTKSRRTVPMLGRLVEVLKSHREEQISKILKLGAKWNENDLVFPARHGTPRQLTNIDRQFKKLLSISGLPTKIRVYDLRHAFASHLFLSGAQVKDVSELLGHSSTRQTEEIYIHLTQVHKKSIVDLLGKNS